MMSWVLCQAASTRLPSHGWFPCTEGIRRVYASTGWVSIRKLPLRSITDRRVWTFGAEAIDSWTSRRCFVVTFASTEGISWGSFGTGCRGRAVQGADGCPEAQHKEGSRHPSDVVRRPFSSRVTYG